MLLVGTEGRGASADRGPAVLVFLGCSRQWPILREDRVGYVMAGAQKEPDHLREVIATVPPRPHLGVRVAAGIDQVADVSGVHGPRRARRPAGQDIRVTCQHGSIDLLKRARNTRLEGLWIAARAALDQTKGLPDLRARE
jgi:hypothetical protein